MFMFCNHISIIIKLSNEIIEHLKEIKLNCGSLYKNRNYKKIIYF